MKSRFILILMTIFFLTISQVAADDFNDTSNLQASPSTFNDLQIIIDASPENATLNLNNDYRYSGSDNSTSGVVIDKPLTINGNGHTLDGGTYSTILKIESNGVVLNNINFINGYGEYYGGAIYSPYELAINNCVFTNNNAGESGGAIYSYDRINITRCNFTNNNAGEYGGAAYLRGSGGMVSNEYVSFIKNSNFNSNTADIGGAVFSGRNLTVSNSNFLNNIAEDSGGAIYTYNGAVRYNTIYSGGVPAYTISVRTQFSLTINGKSTFKNNSANDGGAIMIYANDLCKIRKPVF